jgi:hypothetical protein
VHHILTHWRKGKRPLGHAKDGWCLKTFIAGVSARVHGSGSRNVHATAKRRNAIVSGQIQPYFRQGKAGFQAKTGFSRYSARKSTGFPARVCNLLPARLRQGRTAGYATPPGRKWRTVLPDFFVRAGHDRRRASHGTVRSAGDRSVRSDPSLPDGERELRPGLPT